MTHSAPSILLTALGRGLDTADAQAFGLPVRPLVRGNADIADVVADAAPEPVVYIGTGNLNFDAQCGAALGVSR